MDEVGPPIFDLDRVVDPTDWFGHDDRIRRWAQSVNLKAYTDVFCVIFRRLLVLLRLETSPEISYSGIRC